VKITRRQLRRIIREAVRKQKMILPSGLAPTMDYTMTEDDSGSGKCPPDGCIQKRAKGWIIVSSKTGKCWGRSKKSGGECTYYGSKEKAASALNAYHAGR
jgi:hypothetical protein